MLLTASTVKDTAANLQRFVTGNLAGGVDHLVVFVDAPDDTEPEARDYLDQHPGVTCVPTGDDWWQGDRPAQLNTRQRINANLVKAVLSHFAWADWVFHIDADEIAQIDRAALAAAPEGARAATLAPLEAVSQPEWVGDPTLFKRLLGKDDLTLLHTLGVIDRAHNGAYFHGHVDGKTGVRPALDVWLTLHHAVDVDKEEIEPYRHPGLRLLHYESFSGADFVRKWTQILEAGPSVNFRPAREPTAVALRTLIAKGLSADQARPYLMRIFERTTQDDLVTLRDLGLLEEIDARAGAHVPVAFPPGGLEELTGLLDRLRTAPKRAFHPGQPAADVARLLDDATSVTGGRRSRLRS